MTDVLATTAELEALKKDAGIPHLPTQLTFEARLAICGEGPRAYDWSDKPHRIVYDLCREIEKNAAEREALEQDNHRWKMECENFWRDREKTLTAERDRLGRELNVAKYGVPDFAWSMHKIAMADLEADNTRLREALWAILACETPNANATVTRMASITKAALKGESHD